MVHQDLIFLVLLTANFGLMSKRPPVIRFQPGDRVAEKPKFSQIFATNPESRERIKQYASQRYGTVVGMVYKATRTGAKHPYVSVTWDGCKSPSSHAQSRICLEHELDMYVRDYQNTID